MIYLDSSVLLADYLDQAAAGWARSLWDRDEELVSSFLLVAEVPVVLRRAYAVASTDVTRALEARLARFDEDLDRITVLYDAPAVVDLVRKRPGFSTARTLDALHAAAAWYFQETGAVSVRVATADDRLAEMCRTLGLGVETPSADRR